MKTLDDLEAALREHEGQIDLDVQHFFADGLYARQLYIPEGVTLVGKIKTAEHFSIVYGHVTAVTDDERVELKGFHVVHCKAGTKRAIYAHAHSVWVNVHPTDATTVEEVERTLVLTDYMVEHDAQMVLPLEV